MERQKSAPFSILTTKRKTSRQNSGSLTKARCALRQTARKWEKFPQSLVYGFLAKVRFFITLPGGKRMMTFTFSPQIHPEVQEALNMGAPLAGKRSDCGGFRTLLPEALLSFNDYNII